MRRKRIFWGYAFLVVSSCNFGKCRGSFVFDNRMSHASVVLKGIYIDILRFLNVGDCCC